MGPFWAAGQEVSLVDKIKDAVKESAADLTASLRKSAYGQGWDAECGRSLFVTCDGDTFSVQMSEKAEDTEFGWGKPPAPAIRTWANRQRDIEAAVLRAVQRNLQGVL
jgi:hypothetical protein